MNRAAKSVLGLTVFTFTLAGCSIEIVENRKSEGNSIGESDSESFNVPEGTEAATLMTLPDDFFSDGRGKNSEADKIALTDQPLGSPTSDIIDVVPPIYKPESMTPPFPSASPGPKPTPARLPIINIACASPSETPPGNGLPKDLSPVHIHTLLKSAGGGVIAAKSHVLGCKKIMVALRHLPTRKELSLYVSLKRGHILYTGETEKFSYSGQLLKLPLVMKRSSNISDDDVLIDVIFDDEHPQPAAIMREIVSGETSLIVKKEINIAGTTDTIHSVTLPRNQQIKILGVRLNHLSCIVAQGKCVTRSSHSHTVFKSTALAQALLAAGGGFVMDKTTKLPALEAVVRASTVICGEQLLQPMSNFSNSAALTPPPPNHRGELICVAAPILRKPEPQPIQ
jgi:hypothetical protein